ncbi:glycoside hydrolase [Sabulilitoribacter arenilitoris]|uniref:exo-alpha-sialidase n=1 Tax=Wocania arenilitoris TaxID=2044858 RepID=A0AAE3EPZ9_9FLAO|nr:sialidase family protein [Wocania arenilitoris]MCF7569540.1 glycoside hydrolase [Wocania arenilitoris]
MRYFVFIMSCLLFLNCNNKKSNISTEKKEVKPQEPSVFNTLFKNGDHGYACYRIPAIVTTNNGTVLAFSEARKKGCSDTGDIDLVMKKSSDNGITWSNLKIIWDDKANFCGNPAPVVDRETGTIHLLSTWNNGNDHESEIINETSIETRLVYHLKSTDDGVTWSEPKNITESTKEDDWTWYATGPVHGIQLEKGVHKGRLVIPCDHIEKDSKKYYSHAIYSDDHGETWKLGESTPADQVNECTVAELTNGDLLLNMRNYDRKATKARQIAISKDGGVTWINQKFDIELPEPRCQGALLSIKNNNKNVLLFTNPADSLARVNMTLSVSFDDGLNWDKKLSIYKSHSAYSDLTELKNENILVLYEAGISGAYEGIHYKIIDKNLIFN